jgi:hypothetical protein
MKIKHMQDKCRKEYFVGRIAFFVPGDCGSSKSVL